MTIGKHCQICGKKKTPSQVIAEVHGIVVTAPCLMTKVYGDPPAPRDDVREMAGYCAVCGAGQKKPLPGRCEACRTPLTAESAAEGLAEAGERASMGSRALAFSIDLLLVGLIAGAVIHGIEGYQTSRELARAAEEVGGEGMDFFTFLKLASAAAVFVLYHGLFVSLAGATPGKMLTGLRVVLKNGGRKIDASRALTRAGLYLLTLYVLPVGLLPLLFQKKPSAWISLMEADGMYHDILTDTEVIRPK